MRLNVYKTALVAIILVVLCAHTSSEARLKPYDLDAFMSLEHIGKAMFVDNGKSVLFERLGPYETQANYGRHVVPGGYRAKIFVVSFGDGVQIKPLFHQDEASGYTLGSFSPDGRYIYVLKNGLSERTILLYDFFKRRIVPIQANYQDVWGQDPVWTSQSELIFATAGSGRNSRIFDLHTAHLRRLHDQYHVKQEGVLPTASVLGSGAHRPDYRGRHMGC